MLNKRIVMAVALSLLSACATVTKDHFYTLDAVAPLPDASLHKNTPRYRIAVGPIHVPEIVDRPEMVIREGPNRVKVLETHRWAQSLKSAIAHVLAAALDAQLSEAQVMPDEDYASRNADYRIVVDIERFEGAPGDSVTVDTVWTVFRSSGQALKTGRSTVQEPVQGKEYAAIAAAYGKALSAVSTNIGDAVRLLQAASP